MGFVMSEALRAELSSGNGGDSEVLHRRVVAEAARYADERKELVRKALKKRQNDAGVALTPIDKSKLRSRREAKVHRVKEREFERALKDAIHWLIVERNTNNNTTNNN